MLNLIVTLIEALLAMRIILRFLGANRETPFVRWVYDNSDPLIAPFRGIFPNPVIESQFVIEFSTIFALIIYAFIGYLIIEVVEFLNQRGDGQPEKPAK